MEDDNNNKGSGNVLWFATGGAVHASNWAPLYPDDAPDERVASFHDAQARPENIPDRVPDSVWRVAERVEIGQDIAQSLLTDPRMQAVWQWLQAHANDDGNLESRLASLEILYRMDTWLGPDFVAPPLPDQACASFFISIDRAQHPPTR